MSDLTAAEQANVRKALAFLRARCGGMKLLAKALHTTRWSLRKPASASLTFRVARLAGVSVDDVVTGKYPSPGTCPHCGHAARIDDAGR